MEDGVAATRARNRNSTRCQIPRGRFAALLVSPKAIDSTLVPAGAESLAGRDVGAIRVPIRQIYLTVIGTKQRRRYASSVVRRVPHPLHAQLVVANLSKPVVVAQRFEVIKLVKPAN